jgi:drug/metabolite transporter (DMT)-like permease
MSLLDDQELKLVLICTTLYIHQGIVGWGIMFVVMTWCIQVRGPLFVSMFNPVVLVAVALLGWAILDEKLHVGR